MVDEFRDQVKKSFNACKSDIEELKVENSHLKSKIDSLEISNNELISEIKGLKIAIDYIKDFNKSTSIPQNDIREVTTLKVEEPKTQDPYEALLAFKAKANKRELLKQKLISMIGENGMNLSELKYMFVDHFKYCSKATFYNYLKELEIERIVKIERENSKNYIYLFSVKREV